MESRRLVALVAATCASALGGCASSDEPSGGVGGTGGSGGLDAADDSSGTDATDGSDATSDLDSSDAPAGADWSCVGSVTLPTPVGTSCSLSMTLSDFATNAGVSGIAVKACAKSDATCANPIASGTTDANGAVTLTDVPLGVSGFDGYLDASGGGILPTLVYRSIPASKGLAGAHFPVLTSAEASGVATLLGTSIDATRGHVAGSAVDCSGNWPAGVMLGASTADASTRGFYLVGGAPSATATATDANESNGGGYLNLPVGTATVTAKVQATGVVSSSVDVQVRAGTMTLVYLFPTP